MCRFGLVFLFVVIVGSAVAANARMPQPSCPPPPSTFDLIQRGIFEQHGCTASYCHGDSAQAGLDLRAPDAYDSLLRPGDPENDVVVPGHPEESLLWLKLAAKTLRLRGVPGAPMPIGRLPISPDELQGVQLWIAAGAPKDGFVAGVSTLIDACPSNVSTDEGIPPPCRPHEAGLMLPELIPDPPTDIRILYKNSHRLIEFTTAVANDGTGPLIVQAGSAPTGPGESIDALQVILKADGSKCSRPAGQIMYEVDGYKWAYGSFADFELRKDDPVNGPVVIRQSKSAFCLLDTDPVQASQNLPHQFDAHCEDNIGRMGISSGYKDLYSRVLPAQWLDLDADPSTHVEPGQYYLVNVVDPSKTLLEADANAAPNSSYTRVTVTLPDLNPPAVAPTPSPPSAVSTPAWPRPPHVIRTPKAPHPPRPPHAPRAPHPTRSPRSPHPSAHPAAP